MPMKMSGGNMNTKREITAPNCKLKSIARLITHSLVNGINTSINPARIKTQ